MILRPSQYFFADKNLNICDVIRCKIGRNSITTRLDLEMYLHLLNWNMKQKVVVSSIVILLFALATVLIIGRF